MGRDQSVVGWYHSHPNFGPFLSGTDCETQKSQEMMNPRAVAVVMDPIQSVRGKVIIDAFRIIDQRLFMGKEPRQTTSNIGWLRKPFQSARSHGLDKYYYSIAINYRKNELEQKMLANLHKSNWSDTIKVSDYND